MLLSAASIGEGQRRGCRIDNDRNRFGKSKRGDAAGGKSRHSDDIGWISRAGLAHGGRVCQPAAVNTTRAVGDHYDEVIVISRKEQRLQDMVFRHSNGPSGEW